MEEMVIFSLSSSRSGDHGANIHSFRFGFSGGSLRTASRYCLAGITLLFAFVHPTHAQSGAEETKSAEVDQNSPEALYQRSLQFFTGEGFSQSSTQAMTLLRQSVKMDYPPAINQLAYYNQESIGMVFRNRRKALLLYEQAAELGYVPAMYNLASTLLERESESAWSQALPWFEKAASFDLDSAELSETEWSLYEMSIAEANLRLGLYHSEKSTQENDLKAHPYFLKAAQMGNLRAQLKIARAYAIGIGVEVDLPLAETHIENASRNLTTRIRRMGSDVFAAQQISSNEAYTLEEDAVKQGKELVEAMRITIARELTESEEIEIDPASALVWFQKAAEAGSKFAGTRVGILWLQGHAPSVTEKEALERLKASAKFDHSEAHHALGFYYAHHIETPELDKARKHFAYAAEDGFYDSAIALEDRNLKAQPVFLRTSRLHAIEAYEATKDTESVDVEALFSVGIDYWEGRGDTGIDRRKAGKLFQQAAALNHPHGLYYAAMAYFYGDLQELTLGSLFFSQTSTKSIELFEDAVEKGSTEALYMLGLCYIYGFDGVTKNKALADSYFERLYNKGRLRKGAYGRALVYSESETWTPDWPRALGYYTEAAELGHPRAMVEAGRILLEGKPEQPKDYPAAKTWFETALKDAGGATLGQAHFYLGQIHSEGLGVNGDYLEGFLHYEKAALLNHFEALEIVADTYAEGNEAIQFQPLVAARMYERLVANRKTEYVDPFIKALYLSGDTARFNQMLTTLFDLNMRPDRVRYYRAVRKYEATRDREQKKRALRTIRSLATKGHPEAAAYILKLNRETQKPSKTLRRIASQANTFETPLAYYYLALCGLNSDQWDLKISPQEMIQEAAEAGVIEAIEYLFNQNMTNESRIENELLVEWLTPKAKRGLPEAQKLLDKIIEHMGEGSPEDRSDPDGASGYGSDLA